MIVRTQASVGDTRYNRDMQAHTLVCLCTWRDAGIHICITLSRTSSKTHFGIKRGWKAIMPLDIRWIQILIAYRYIKIYHPIPISNIETDITSYLLLPDFGSTNITYSWFLLNLPYLWSLPAGPPKCHMDLHVRARPLNLEVQNLLPQKTWANHMPESIQQKIPQQKGVNWTND